MISEARFFGGAMFVPTAVEVALAARDVGGIAFVTFGAGGASAIARLPWTDEQSGQAASKVNQQRNTGCPCFLIQHAGGSSRVSVRDRANNLIVQVNPGQAALIRLRDRDPSYYGTWDYDLRTLV